MTTSKVKRVTAGALPGYYGPDEGRRLVVTFIPGDGRQIKDLLEIRPHGTRRPERITVLDVYRFALQCRVNAAQLDRARAAKARKAERLARQRQERAERRMFPRKGEV
jgi:hypothetical protein